MIRLALAVVAAFALASCSVAAAFPDTSDGTTSFPTAHSDPTRDGNAPTDASERTSAERTSSSCVVNAIGAAPVAHGVPEYFPPAMAATSALAQPEATQLARELAAKFGGAVAPKEAAAVAREMSYGDFVLAAEWPANSGINPQRCVWVITVHAAMQIKVAPGRPGRSVDVYTVAIDAGSGTLIGLLAGRDLFR
jgi:hypothetical protein